jgi:hypothetical protein
MSTFLVGPVLRASGTAGTVTLVSGAKIIQIKAFAAAAATIQIFDDAAVITLPANSGWFTLQENHNLATAPNGTPTIIFTSTTSYYVEYSLEGS